MIKERWFEIILGGVVLGVAMFFLIWGWNSSGSNQGSGGAKIFANFSSVKGIKLGNDVRIGGVKIGTVSDMSIDPQSFKARIEMAIRKDLKLPTDSKIAIISDGFLGGAFIRIIPGQAQQYLGSGEQLTRIQQSLSLEELLGKAIFIISDSSS